MDEKGVVDVVTVNKTFSAGAGNSCSSGTGDCYSSAGSVSWAADSGPGPGAGQAAD